MQSLGVSVVAVPFVQCQLAGGCLTDANMSFASEDVEILFTDPNHLVSRKEKLPGLAGTIHRVAGTNSGPRRNALIESFGKTHHIS